MLEKSTKIISEPLESSLSIRLDLRSWPEVESYLKQCKGVILPIGSTEQHGPTGAIGTDALTAEAVGLELGRLTGIFVTPVQAFGMAEHHLGFPGTMSLKPTTLINVINDLVLSLAQNGFERIFFVNGHGGNIAPLKAAFHQIYSNAINQNLPVASNLRLKLANWFMAPEVFQEARKLYGDREGQHATPSEIALTLHLFPSLLDKHRPLPAPAPVGPINNHQDFRARYPDGRMGSDPYLAKPLHGKTLLEIAAKSLSKQLLTFLEES